MTILENNGVALRYFIEAILPIHIAQYQRRGGITDTDIERARNFADDLACRGDALLFGGKPGEAEDLAGRLVDALAVMSFSPGGLNNIERWLEGFEQGHFTKLDPPA